MAEALRRGLSELGWTEGQNILVEYRYAEGQSQRYAAMMAEFVNLKVDVIVSGGGERAARAAKQLTQTIPIVVPVMADPVAAGLVENLARPGGNITGQSMQDTDISSKRLHFLRQLVPTLERVAILDDPGRPPVIMRATESAARAMGLQPLVFSAGRRLEDLEHAFNAMREAHTEALMVPPSSLFNAQRQRLVDLAAQHRLVTIYEHRRFTEIGGLIAYGPNIVEMYRSAARYVDKILKGAKPADLPIEQPTKFELVINLKTAKALDLTIPPLLLFQATEVIE
jgi:putative ABC transport system substrate-binding protein